MSRPQRYTREEIRFLRENVDKMTNEELALRLGRSKNAITNYICVHGLGRSGPLWTPEQVEYLKAHYETGYVKDIVAGVHHDWYICQEKAKELGLERHANNGRAWTRQEIRLFDEFMERGVSYAEMEQVLNRSRDALRWRKTMYYPGWPMVPPSPTEKVDAP